jgi:predicted NAD-dependent protein-ADP-ribosyltransferase YbiA (DUF1768 family)
MVQSRLDQKVNYKEADSLFEDDKEYEAELYDITLFDNDVVIAVGNPRYDFIEHNIVYYPAYLVKDSAVASQIGVYEIGISELENVIDDEGVLDLTKINKILLYSNINKEMFASAAASAAASEAEPKANAVEASAALEIETSTEASALAKAEFKKVPEKDKKKLNWVQRFMRNMNYGMVDNEGKGECLFAVIRDGLKTVNKEKSVPEIRKLLAAEATEELFQTYQTLYENALAEDKQLANELKVLAARHKGLNTNLKLNKDRIVQSEIIAQAEEVQKTHKEKKEERQYSKNMLGEFSFMKGVTTLTKLREKIQTCSFWGDTWAISTIERVLNIKLIILSGDYYNDGDIENVLQCGQLNDDIEASAKFTPTHYIIANHHGAHYQLITYKNYGAFTFQQLPYDVKMLIVNKCLEKAAGPYLIIPDFQELRAQDQAEQDQAEQDQAEQDDDVILIEPPKQAQAQQAQTKSIQQTQAQQMQTKSVQQAQTQQVQPSSEEIYNENGAVFQFYIGSMDKPAPGSGAGEKLGGDQASEYTELKKINGWRKMLSNFWTEPFELHAHKWFSVEHYYNAAKFKRKNPDFYLQFSLDSNSEISTDPYKATAAGSKNGKFQGNLIRPKTIEMDDDFFKGRDLKEMEDAMFAKFSQHAELKRVLLATKKAKLTHFIRGTPPMVYYDLMQVRKKIQGLQ